MIQFSFQLRNHPLQKWYFPPILRRHFDEISIQSDQTWFSDSQFWLLTTSIVNRGMRMCILEIVKLTTWYSGLTIDFLRVEYFQNNFHFFCLYKMIEDFFGSKVGAKNAFCIRKTKRRNATEKQEARKANRSISLFFFIVQSTLPLQTFKILTSMPKE